MKNIIIIVTVLVTSSSFCTQNAKNSSDKKEKVNIKEIESPLDSIIHPKQDLPFADSNCNATLKELGRKYFDKNKMNIYIKGKGFDQNNENCQFYWGEFVYNVDKDSGIDIQKIFLLDLDKFEIPDGNLDFGTDTLNKYVISMYIFNRNGIKKSQIIYDPFKTGKYTKLKD